MVTLNISEEDYNKLIQFAREPIIGNDEDFNPQDHAGGNIDDAYSLGTGDGFKEGVRHTL